MGKKDLPLDSGQRISDIFVKSFGWTCVYGKNHFVLTHPEKSPNLFLSIPDHKQVDRNLLRTELRKAEISIEDFCNAYKGR
ncbi:MAG TPA: hypothetical protein VND90_05745 [Terracidiphilus sp.]|nr:hypothetical protein [Terracidiphilus sp.]